MATTYLPGATRPANPLCRVIKAIEPWYDWGSFGILRVDGDGEGDGRFFAIDWFGLHLMIVVGRTPAKLEG